MPSRPDTQSSGRWGEDVAAAFLLQAGYKILGRRVRPNRRDEIDIVARKEQSLAFVEVKMRTSEEFARPVSAVNAAKRHALNRAAVAYLRQLDFPQMYYRFDTIEIVGAEGAAAPVIRHTENAFPFEKRLMLGQ